MNALRLIMPVSIVVITCFKGTAQNPDFSQHILPAACDASSVILQPYHFRDLNDIFSKYPNEGEMQSLIEKMNAEIASSKTQDSMRRPADNKQATEADMKFIEGNNEINIEPAKKGRPRPLAISLIDGTTSFLYVNDRFSANSYKR